jgi:hypothetical protein
LFGHTPRQKRPAECGSEYPRLLVSVLLLLLLLLVRRTPRTAADFSTPTGLFRTRRWGQHILRTFRVL